MEKLLLIDGNSIMNRAFYGIMSSKMLTTNDGKYTNALYGFLSILFKNLEEVNPDYLLVAFDSKTGADVRKQKYDGYKKSRHKMPEELAEQMPEIKEILKAMNINYLEMDNYEGDDILGSCAKQFSNSNVKAYILSGDRDLFQLVDENVIVRIPRTKMGKTETEIYDLDKVREEYQMEPEGLIELKALMGDSSDEIPGVPGVGPKTATELLKEYKTIEELYKAVEQDENCEKFKPKLREKLVENKHLAEISKEIGRIDIKANLPFELEDLRIKEWNKEEVTKLFKYYRFNRFMERFKLKSEGAIGKSGFASAGTMNDNGLVSAGAMNANGLVGADTINKNGFTGANAIDENGLESIEDLENSQGNFKVETVIKNSIKDISISDTMIYYLETEKDDSEENIIKKKIVGIGIYEDGKVAYVRSPKIEELKEIFENEKIEKIGFNLSEDYVLLRQNGIKTKSIKYDIEVACYDIDPSNVKHKLSDIALQFLDVDIESLIPSKQINLFDINEDDKNEIGIYVLAIKILHDVTKKELEKEGSLRLFEEIEIPLITVLGEIQYNGMLVDKDELVNFGKELKQRIDELTKEIYELADEEFNINSTQQLGKILFEKLKLPGAKKNKKGYSTDVAVLEKLILVHPIIEKILEYRTLTKLNSTYVEGLVPYINKKTGRIHSYFHQTITATGRISSTEPNLQNIPSREEIGRNIKKAFKPAEGYVYLDADYSQIELRVLSDMANDANMINAFKNDEDIHREVASRVFGVPLEEVTKEQRSRAKAVNFGIVYGITDFGLGQQIGIGRKEAKQYIESYLEKYSGIKEYMEKVTEKAKETGYVETAFGRRRYIPELKSSNYMVREFGKRAAMNTPIQGTAADIMKIAMNTVYKKLEESKLDAKIILQVHDELILEVKEEEKEEAEKILKESMENATKLKIPLKVEVTDAKSWYDAK